MAKSVFRRFPSGELETELPEWEDVNVDGQTLVKRGTGSAAHELAASFFEAEQGGGPVALAGAATSTANALANLLMGQPVAGASSGITSGIGMIDVRQQLLGASSGTGSNSAAASIAQRLAGSSSGLADLLGGLKLEQAIQAVSGGSSTSLAQLLVGQALSSISQGQALAEGVLGIGSPLSGSSDGSSSLLSAMMVAQELIGMSVGDSYLAGILGIDQVAQEKTKGNIKGNHGFGAMRRTTRMPYNDWRRKTREELLEQESSFLAGIMLGSITGGANALQVG